LQVEAAIGGADNRRKALVGVALAKQQEQGRTLIDRRAIDDQGRHDAVGIQAQVFRILLRQAAEIDQAQFVRQAEFEHGQVDHHAGRTG
jgi:hypothetical protein